jgi:hypothetical protein
LLSKLIFHNFNKDGKPIEEILNEMVNHKM